MEDYIYYIILTVAAFYAGWYVREFSATLCVKSMLAEIRENEEVEDSARMYATIELKDEMIFMYDKTTNEYLGHSTNFADLENMLKSKFPNKTFGISQDDMQKLMK